MKTQWLSVFFLSLSNYALAQQTGTSILEKFLQEKDFLKLEASYRQQKDTLSELNSLYYGAFIDNASNRCTQSAKKIESLLKYHKSELTPQTAPPLLNVQMDNFVKLNAYRKAAKVGEQILASYSTFLDSAKVADLKNTIKLWRALENVPPQQITKVESRVKWTRDKIGLMNIPIRIGNQVSDFVFDTGANLSTISLSYAQKLKLKIIATSIDLGSSTSIQNQAMLAIA
ncbi:MAG: retropepsin-like domain-containing protein, partial [Olivibacter sp.]|nr:retropepsin-like domain-containing protein [Olivibacter sp. UJ_SKK_5.1]